MIRDPSGTVGKRRSPNTCPQSGDTTRAVPRKVRAMTPTSTMRAFSRAR
jgi:hypothetical protein